jgi:hypothetical protein
MPEISLFTSPFFPDLGKNIAFTPKIGDCSSAIRVPVG